MNHRDMPRVAGPQRTQAVLLSDSLPKVAVARARGEAVRVVGDIEHE